MEPGLHLEISGRVIRRRGNILEGYFTSRWGELWKKSEEKFWKDFEKKGFKRISRPRRKEATYKKSALFDDGNGVGNSKKGVTSNSQPLDIIGSGG